MNSPIPFHLLDWSKVTATTTNGEQGSATSRTMQFPGLRVRIVTYSPGYLADHWCQKGHVVHCLSGSVETQMEAGSSTHLQAGMTYTVSDDMSSHRSYSEEGAQLLIVDGDFLAQGKNPTRRSGAVGAILDEYEKALNELKSVLLQVSDTELLQVVDPDTEDPNCKSIQTILAHVVRSGYTYIILVNSLKGPLEPYRDRIYRTTMPEFLADLDAMFAFNVTSLSKFQDAELEEYQEAKKLLTPWGQRYDPEQILEHAIVHILRHRRQIQGFLNRIRG